MDRSLSQQRGIEKEEPMDPFLLARSKEIDYHNQFYKETELFQPGSWPSRPVKALMDTLELLDYKDLQVLDLGGRMAENLHFRASG